MSDRGSDDEPNRLGEQLERLSLSKGKRNFGDASISAVLGAPGHVFFGPYLSVPPGPYSVRMIFAAEDVGRDPGLALEAAWGADTIASVCLDEITLESGLVAFQFVVPSKEESVARKTEAPKLEIRLFSEGAQKITITSVDLRRMSASLRQFAAGERTA